MRHARYLTVVAALLLLFSPSTARAQAPAAPPPPPSGPWTATASFGLALTSGNSDTSTVNAGYDVTYDPKLRNLVKSEGLFLRGKSAGELTADRVALAGRDEYRIYPRVFVFGQMQYLRDRFKDIDYLVAPSAGLGVRLEDTARTKFSVDAGAGSIWEKKPVGDVDQSGLLEFSDHFSHQLSPSATITQSLSGLYKTENFSDALYAFSAAVAASVAARIQLKVEVLDTYKNLVVEPIKKNDVALLVGVVFKY